MELLKILKLSSPSFIFCIASLVLHIGLKIDGKRIAFFPYFEASYVLTSIRAANSLVSFGHDVYICIPEHAQHELSHEIHKSLNVILYTTKFGDLDEAFYNYTDFTNLFWLENRDEIMMDRGSTFASDFYQSLLTNKDFINHLHELQVDLYVFDSHPNARPALLLAYKFDTRFAFMGTFYDILGARIPSFLTTVPNIYSITKSPGQLSLSRRLRSGFSNLKSYLRYDSMWDDSFVKNVLPEKDPVSYNTLAVQAEIFLVETEHVLDFARPSLPNVRLIGGISSYPSNPLPVVVNNFLACTARTTGFIAVSFGTLDKQIPEKIMDMLKLFLSTFSIPVVWLTRDNQSVSTFSRGNIQMADWYTQNDVLGHEDILALISHCDTRSQYEALYHAVPMLCLPLFGEQFYNAERVEVKGLGAQADIRTISARSLTSLTHRVANNASYRRNMKLASALFREECGIPSEAAAWWIDHVTLYGGGYMRFPGQDMPLYQALSLDVYIVELTLLAVLAGFVWWFCLGCSCTNSKEIKHETRLVQTSQRKKNV